MFIADYTLFTYIFYVPLYLVAYVNFLLNEYDDDDDDDDDDATTKPNCHLLICV